MIFWLVTSIDLYFQKILSNRVGHAPWGCVTPPPCYTLAPNLTKCPGFIFPLKVLIFGKSLIWSIFSIQSGCVRLLGGVSPHLSAMLLAQIELGVQGPKNHYSLKIRPRTLVLNLSQGRGRCHTFKGRDQPSWGRDKLWFETIFWKYRSNEETCKKSSLFIEKCTLDIWHFVQFGLRVKTRDSVILEPHITRYIDT